MRQLEVPALVVGAGPVGLTAAALLAHDGRRSLVVERRDGPRRQPAAHAVNARTLEIFRQTGFDMAAIDAIAIDPADAGHVNWVTTLAGRLIGRLPYERQGPEMLEITPTPLRNISQHRLEPLLSSEVAALSGVDLRYRTEWLSSEQDRHGVTSVLRDLDDGTTLEVRSRYLLAADGASSRVRASLGIEMEGPARLESFVMVHFRADLRAFVADRPGVLHFVMDPTVSGCLVAHDIDREWVYMFGFDPDHESLDDFDTHRTAGLVRAAIGDLDVDVEILDTATWHMSAQVATSMRDRRIFLLGDAAHRFPPTGGLGLNTGVADAQGLVWKLAAVEDGWADPSILDTYGAERRPIAESNCEQSVTNAMKLFGLVEALGLGAGSTSEDLLAVLADPANDAAITDAIRAQTTHFDMVGLQLGYCYADGALVRSGDAPPPITDPSQFTSAAVVGGRLPHAWLADGRSTLDLIPTSGLTLISFGGHDAWAAAAHAVGPRLHHVRLTARDAPSSEWLDHHTTGDAALLVRPDQHIAWLADDASEAAHLGGAIAQVLGRVHLAQPKANLP